MCSPGQSALGTAADPPLPKRKLAKVGHRPGMRGQHSAQVRGAQSVLCGMWSHCFREKKVGVQLCHFAVQSMSEMYQVIEPRSCAQ